MSTPLVDALASTLLPNSNRPSPESYYGLLTDPPGQYGCMKYGGTLAITLRGSPLFASRAANLFSSFGGESIRTIEGTSYRYTTSLNLREGDLPNTWFFCLPPERVRMALRSYLYAQIYAHKAKVKIVLDEEGDFIDTILLNEDDMMLEASQLADSFVKYEIGVDYGVQSIDTILGSASDQTEYNWIPPSKNDNDEPND